MKSNNRKVAVHQSFKKMNFVRFLLAWYNQDPSTRDGKVNISHLSLSFSLNFLSSLYYLLSYKRHKMRTENPKDDRGN